MLRCVNLVGALARGVGVSVRASESALVFTACCAECSYCILSSRNPSQHAIDVYVLLHSLPSPVSCERACAPTGMTTHELQEHHSTPKPVSDLRFGD